MAKRQQNIMEEFDDIAPVDHVARAREYMENMHPISHMTWNDPLYIPEEAKPDGWDYYWVRESLLGDPQSSRLGAMRRNGWRIVEASRHPEMCFADPFGRASYLQGCIHHGGLVLCERPKAMGDKERLEFESHNDQLVQNMAGLHNFLGDRHFPTARNASYAERGAGVMGRQDSQRSSAEFWR